MTRVIFSSSSVWQLLITVEEFWCIVVRGIAILKSSANKSSLTVYIMTVSCNSAQLLKFYVATRHTQVRVSPWQVPQWDWQLKHTFLGTAAVVTSQILNLNCNQVEISDSVKLPDGATEIWSALISSFFHTNPGSVHLDTHTTELLSRTQM